jgi:hypothetical protein
MHGHGSTPRHYHERREATMAAAEGHDVLVPAWLATAERRERIPSEAALRRALAAPHPDGRQDPPRQRLRKRIGGLLPVNCVVNRV